MKNIHNSACWMYNTFQKNVENATHITNSITKKIYIIFYVQRTQFFEKLSKYCTIDVHNFKKGGF